MIVEKPPSIDFPKQGTTVFLGGGISGCPMWQDELIEKIKRRMSFTEKRIHVFNPRWDYAWTAYQQIEWEFNKLREADIIVMWFASGGQNRIVFYELGMWINSTGRKAVIGCDPLFDRKEDVVIQTKLARPDLTIYTSLDDVSREVYNLL